MASRYRGEGDLSWLASARTNFEAGESVDLTAEQLHTLCLLLDLKTVPGLGPLPIDRSPAGAEDLMIETALRGLRAWGAVAQGPGHLVVDAALERLLRDLAAAVVLIQVSETRADALDSALWAVSPEALVVLSWMTPTDYRLRRLDPGDLSSDLSAFLGIEEGGEAEDDAAAVDGDWFKPSLYSAADRAIVGALTNGRRVNIVIESRSGLDAEFEQVRLLESSDGDWWQIDAPADGSEAAIKVRRLAPASLEGLVVGLVPDDLGSREPVLVDE